MKCWLCWGGGKCYAIYPFPVQTLSCHVTMSLALHEHCSYFCFRSVISGELMHHTIQLPGKHFVCVSFGIPGTEKNLQYIQIKHFCTFSRASSKVLHVMAVHAVLQAPLSPWRWSWATYPSAGRQEQPSAAASASGQRREALESCGHSEHLCWTLWPRFFVTVTKVFMDSSQDQWST